MTATSIDVLTQLEALLATRVDALTSGDRECAALRTAIAALAGSAIAAPPRTADVSRPPRAKGEESSRLMVRLVDCLKSGPKPFREMVDATGATTGSVKRALISLAEEQRAHCVGWSSAARWYLGPKPATPAKEAVQRGRA